MLPIRLKATFYTSHFENVIGNDCGYEKRSAFVRLLMEQADILLDYMVFD